VAPVNGKGLPTCVNRTGSGERFFNDYRAEVPEDDMEHNYRRSNPEHGCHDSEGPTVTDDIVTGASMFQNLRQASISRVSDAR
jgi:hypothetical protein